MGKRLEDECRMRFYNDEFIDVHNHHPSTSGSCTARPSLKIFKNFGMTLKDARGERVQVDDPRLDSVFEKCAELGIPVLIHTAEPGAFFEPQDRYSERWLLQRRVLRQGPPYRALPLHPPRPFGRRQAPRRVVFANIDLRFSDTH
jgi:hypothetical protein